MRRNLDNRILGDPGTDAFQVEKYPFFLLNRLVATYNRRISKTLSTIGLDIPDWRTLMILGERSPRSVMSIADAAVIPVSTMTRIVQRMQGASLVSIQNSRADGRVTEVLLTTLGKSALAKARKAVSPIYADLIDGFDEHEFDMLLAMLNRLNGNLRSSRV